MEDPDVHYHLLGEMNGTPYGDMKIYYTGTDPALAAIKLRRYQFFGNHHGYVEEDAKPGGLMSGVSESWGVGSS